MFFTSDAERKVPRSKWRMRMHDIKIAVFQYKLKTNIQIRQANAIWRADNGWDGKKSNDRKWVSIFIVRHERSNHIGGAQFFSQPKRIIANSDSDAIHNGYVSVVEKPSHNCVHKA